MERFILKEIHLYKGTPFINYKIVEEGVHCSFMTVK